MAFNSGVHPTLRHRLATPVRLTDSVLAALASNAKRRRAAFNERLRGDPAADTRGEACTASPDDVEMDGDGIGQGLELDEERDQAAEADAVELHDAYDTAIGHAHANEEQDIFGHGFSLDEMAEGDSGAPLTKRRRVQTRDEEPADGRDDMANLAARRPPMGHLDERENPSGDVKTEGMAAYMPMAVRR